MAEWQVEALDRFGGGIIPLDGAQPETLSDKLNFWRRSKISIGVADQGAIAADLLNCQGTRRTDIRLHRNGQRMLWGPITRADADRARVHVQVADPLWHFAGLRFGPIRGNLLVNGNGDQGTAGWTTSGGAVLTVDPSDFAQRPQCFRLQSSGADADAFMGQLVEVTSNPDQPVVFILSGWAKIDPTAWAGPALEERGLYIARVNDALLPKWAPVTEAIKFGEWVYYRKEMTVPAASTELLDCRAYAVDGIIRWGRLRLWTLESVGTPQYPEDAIHPMTRVINLAQDPAWGYPPLNVTKAGGPTGTAIEIHHQFIEREEVGEALLGYTRKGICDIGVVYPDPSTRTLEVFSPRRGVFHEDLLLDIDPAASLADVRYAVDGEQTYSAVGAPGPEGEEAFAFDYSANGGIRREKRLDSTDQAIADLEPRAAEELERAKAPVLVPTYRTHELSGDLVGVINVGDRVRCRIAYGCIQEEAVRRVVGWDLDCRTDTMTLEVNA